jgi:hypothetical protein
MQAIHKLQEACMSVQQTGSELPVFSHFINDQNASKNRPLSQTVLSDLISRRLNCMPRGTVSQFLTQREIARQKDMSRDLQDTAENIELYKTGLEELPLGELMAFDGKHTLFKNKELWKRKIENASQDRGLLSLNAPSISDECFTYFLEALREIPQVKMLCIDTNLTDSQLTMLAREIDAKDPFPLKLESISFNMDNRPQPEVMEQLFTAIGTNPFIQQLTFRDYVFSDKDAEHLNTNLYGHRGLATISIKFSVFYENGMRSLIDLLRRNSNLSFSFR